MAVRHAAIELPAHQASMGKEKNPLEKAIIKLSPIASHLCTPVLREERRVNEPQLQR